MEGKVIKSTGSWYSVEGEDGKIYECRLRGKIKMEGIKTTNPIAVGDNVIFDLEEKGDQSAVISSIKPRENYVIRKSTHNPRYGHILAANIDQAILIATLAYPVTSLGFIDRFLVTAESFRIPVIIVFNKKDLMDEEMMRKYKSLSKMYEHIGYKCMLISALEEQSFDEFYNILTGKTSLLSGHSGVGKSTLLNRIDPAIAQKTLEVSTFSQKGVHSTTFAEMFKIAEHTYIIDTPGIKELGLLEIAPEELFHYFPELRDLMGKCKFYNCTHTHEPGCAIEAAFSEGKISESRYRSYLSMLEDEDNRR